MREWYILTISFRKTSLLDSVLSNLSPETTTPKFQPPKPTKNTPDRDPGHKSPQKPYHTSHILQKPRRAESNSDRTDSTHRVTLLRNRQGYLKRTDIACSYPYALFAGERAVSGGMWRRAQPRFRERMIERREERERDRWIVDGILTKVWGLETVKRKRERIIYNFFYEKCN